MYEHLGVQVKGTMLCHCQGGKDYSLPVSCMCLRCFNVELGPADAQLLATCLGGVGTFYMPHAKPSRSRFTLT